MKLERIDCPLCGRDEPTFLFSGIDREFPIPGDFPVVRCSGCRLIYLNPRPAEESLGECYPDAYDSYGFGGGPVGRLQRWLRKRTARALAQIFPKHGRVLEIGCASGDLLLPLRDTAGLQVTGVELSPYAASLAQAQGLDVHVGRLSDAKLSDASFDGVVMRNVLEHLPDPLADLRRVATLLKPDGKLFIAIPNHDGLDRKCFGRFWYAYETPRHLTVPSEGTVTEMLRRCGFEVVSINHSLVPNSWISSVRFLAEDLLGMRCRLKWINYKNPLLLALALPFGVLQKILRMSGRIDVIARKKA